MREIQSPAYREGFRDALNRLPPSKENEAEYTTGYNYALEVIKQAKAYTKYIESLWGGSDE